MVSPPNRAPAFLWRLSKFEDLSGRGGLRVSGRWHTRPKSILYCAAEPHTAYLELLRQFGDELLFPDSLKALKIGVPKRLSMETVDVADLDPSWSDEASGYAICQPIGDEWLRSMRTPLLKVPSVAGPGRHNILVNPAHPEAEELFLHEIFRQPFPDLIKKA